MAVGGAISAFGALSGWNLPAGQIPMAAARDGLFPAIFGRLAENGVPSTGLVISGVLSSLLRMVNYIAYCSWRAFPFSFG